eukprot:881496-Amphidinium_carterae.2
MAHLQLHRRVTQPCMSSWKNAGTDTQDVPTATIQGSSCTYTCNCRDQSQQRDHTKSTADQTAKHVLADFETQPFSPRPCTQLPKCKRLPADWAKQGCCCDKAYRGSGLLREAQVLACRGGQHIGRGHRQHIQGASGTTLQWPFVQAALSGGWSLCSQ